MMNIGEFAALTGLTVRALRHYDEQGILIPAEVDRSSRYRRYTAEQLPLAMKLAALRRAELPLADVSRILDGEAEIAEVIAAHRTRLQDEHTRQQGKLSALEMLAVLETQRATGPEAAPVTVELQQAEPQHWAGFEYVIDEAAIARARELGAELMAGGALPKREDPSVAVHRSLSAAGNPPVGPSWVSLEVGDEDTPPKVLFCWPVAQRVPDDWTVPGWRTVTGRFEAGAELVARGSHESLSVFEMVGQLPGVVAVLREAERRGLEVDLGSVRAIRNDSPTDDEGATRFEVAIRVCGPDDRRQQGPR